MRRIILSVCVLLAVGCRHESAPKKKPAPEPASPFRYYLVSRIVSKRADDPQVCQLIRDAMQDQVLTNEEYEAIDELDGRLDIIENLDRADRQRLEKTAE